MRQGAGLQRIRLLQPGAKSGLLTFARAQLAGVEAGYIGPDGATWQTAAADVLRFQGTAQRSLWEGQRTDPITNPRCEGATGLTRPTGWTVSIPAGLSATYTRQTRNGVEGVVVAITGTASSTANIYIFTGLLTGVTQGSAVAWSHFAQVDVDSAAITSMATNISEYTSGGSYVATGGLNWYSTRMSWARREYLRTLTGATTGRAQAEIVTNTISSGTAVTFTFWVGWPQLELGAFASTPTLPPVASPAASTRGADLGSAAWSWRRGVILWSGRWLQNAPIGIDQTAFQLDDASDSNRFRIRNAGGGATVVAGRVTGGSAVDATTLGSMTAGTMTAVGLAVDLDAGTYKAMLRGDSVQSGTGGPTSASIARVGNNYAATAATSGECERYELVPGIYPSDSLLASLVNNMPLSA